MTNIDCHNKEGVRKALRSYRLRWPIEEFFRFAKCEFGLERFQIPSLKAMNNFFLIVEACCCFIGKAILSHTQGRPEVVKRTRKPKANQLTLF